MEDLGQNGGIVRGKVKTIMISGLLVSALSFVFFIATQKHFKASSDILIVQNQSGFSDFYAMSKSAEYLTNILVESVYSEKFLDEVRNSNMVRSQFLPEDKLERLKVWEKMVKVRRVPNLGIVHIEVYSDNQKEALEISQAMIQVITSKSVLFWGNSQTIESRVMSGPLWQKNPSLESVAAVMGGGFLMGAMLSVLWFYYRKESYMVPLSGIGRLMESGR